MFTGLVTDLGTILSVKPREKGVVLSLRTAYDLSTVELGASIAVDGVCLTVETKDAGLFTATAGRETMERTTLGVRRPGDRVHLEQALRAGDRLGGHLVQGHVDGVGTLRSSFEDGESWVLWVEAPPELSRYIAEKGSICIDGVSLTVNELRGDAFRVNVIPHTARSTHMTTRRPGEGVNLEVDVLARYVERLLRAESGGGNLSFERLRALGYTGKER
jgi:riboflavin synthase